MESAWQGWGVALAMGVVLVMARLRASRQQQRLAAQLQLARIRIDLAGRIVAVAGPVAELLGYQREELIGDNVTRLMPAQVAADHDGYVRRFAASLQGTVGSSRVLGRRRLVRALHRDGHEVSLVLCAGPKLVRGRLRFDGLLQPLPSEGVPVDQVQPDERAPSLDWRWLRNFGHEVRTPMAAIKGHAEILVDSRSAEGERQSSAVAVLAACRHLLELLNDLLDHARLVAGERKFHPTPSDVRQLLADVREIVRGSAERKGLAIEVAVDADLPALQSLDSLSFRQVLLNLTGNAVKFTECGFVRIEASHVAERLRVDVLDTGIGIGQGFAPALFEPFQQEHRAEASGEGSGLGLSICRQLARRMGGDLTLVDSAPGVGSRFRLELPMHAVEVAAASPEEGPAPAASPQLRGLRCLLVDDTRDLLRLARAVLEQAGAEVTACLDGAAALREFDDADAPFDVAVLDLMMPRMDGFELLAMLRQRGFGGPAIAVSAADDDTTAAACLASGFAELIGKPWHRGGLVAALDRAARPAPKPVQARR